MSNLAKKGKKRERGQTKRALIEIKHLVPHFTSYQLAVRAQMTIEQAQKCCGYLKKLGYLKVIGSARFTGAKGEPASMYEVTEAYEKARKENPTLFEPLKLVSPTSIEKAREKKAVVDPQNNMTLMCKKIDGLIEVVWGIIEKVNKAHSHFASEQLGIATAFDGAREQLQKLKEIKPTS